MISQVWELKNRFINLQKEKKQSESDNYVTYTFNHDQLGEEVMLMSFPTRTMVTGYNLNGTDYIAEPIVTQETTEISEFILTNVGYCTTSLISLSDLTVNTRWRAKQPLSENDQMVLAMNLGETYALESIKTAEIPQWGWFFDYGNNEYGFLQEAIDEIQLSGDANLGIFFAESTWDGFTTIPTIDTEVAQVKTNGGIQNISIVPTSNTSELTIYCTDSFDSLGYCNKEIVRKIDGGGCNSVTSIRESEFGNYTELTHITIPNSVVSIGNDAFYNCSGLTSITIPNGVTSIKAFVFSNCIRLTSIKIPNNVTNIEDYAFHDCTGLTSIEIPNSVTSIGNSAFDGCSGLTSITIPNSVTSIGNSAFDGCSGLTSITIPNSVKTIGESAFDGCSGLTSITIPNSVTSIEENAFNNCTNIKELCIEDGVTILNLAYDSIVNKGLFYDCPLETLYLGRDLSYDPRYSPFYNIKTLKNVTISNSVTSLGHSAFHGCEGITSIEIPKGVTEIGDYAFTSCYGLISIIIPEGVTKIGENTFAWCFNLTDIIIPQGMIEIGENAFKGCEELTSITLPNSVTSIGYDAFDGCNAVKEITCLAETAPVLRLSVFTGTTTGTLKIPKGSDYSSWLEDLGSGWTIEEIETP